VLSRPFTPTRRPAALGYFLLASVWCIVFYSIAGSKRSGYILPAMPPLALALGCFLERWLTTVDRAQTATARSPSGFAFRTTLALLGIAIVGSVLAPSAELLDGKSATLLAGAGIFALVAVYRLGRNRTPTVAWGVCGLTTFAVLFFSL